MKSEAQQQEQKMEKESPHQTPSSTPLPDINAEEDITASAESLPPTSTSEQPPSAGRVTTTMPSVNSPSGATLMSPAHYALPPNVHISGMMSPASSNRYHTVMGFDPSQLMILQQVDGQGKVTSSPAVTAMDALKLGLVPTTPLMAMSPMAAPTLVAPPGTPIATYNPGDPNITLADWSQHYLQIANLQNRTTGFLSPAGQPLSPAPMVHGATWNPLTTATTPGLVTTPLSMRTSAPPMDVNGTPNKQVDDRNSDSRTREASEKALGAPGLSAATHATEDNHLPSPQPHAWLGANGYSPFPAGAYAPIPTHLMPSANMILKGQSDAATAGATSSNKLVEDHLSLFASSAATGVAAQHDFANSTPNGIPGSKPDGRLVDTVLHAKSLTEQMLREFSVEGAADVLRTALSLLGRPSTGAGDGTDTQTTVGDLGDVSTGAASTALPSVKLVHPDEFKNASTFLKIYGDPLCFTKNGPLPKKGRNGNWECSKCNNVNFPRRFRCNMCSTTRDEEGDRVVSEYARQVYERYIFIYRNQQSQNGGVQQIILDRDPLVVESQPPPPPSNQSGPMTHTAQAPPSVAGAHSATSSRQSGNFHHQQQPQSQHNPSYARGGCNRSYGTGGNAQRGRYSRPHQQYESQQSAQLSAGYNNAAYGSLANGNTQQQYAVSQAVVPQHHHQQQPVLSNQYAAAGRQDYSVYNY